MGMKFFYCRFVRIGPRKNVAYTYTRSYTTSTLCIDCGLVQIHLGRERAQGSLSLVLPPSAGDEVAHELADPHARVGHEGQDDEFGLVVVAAQRPPAHGHGRPHAAPHKVVRNHLLADRLLAHAQQRQHRVVGHRVVLAAENVALVVAVQLRVAQVEHRQHSHEAEPLQHAQPTLRVLVLLLKDRDV